jgi:molybdopterin-guanine dinucleotide biosynthesis protein A
MTVRGVILAGGGATRFGGQPKGLEVVGGSRILDRLVSAFEEAHGSLPLLVSGHSAAATWRANLRVVPDVRPGLGNLGGIYSAVVEGPAPVVLVGWDMPFVPAALIRELGRRLNDCDACLPESDGRRGVEPLCAAYGPACRDAIERALEEGDRRAIAFHRFVRVGILKHTEVRSFGSPERLFFNVNTPADLERARELV